jgi:hypothetical protein
MECTCKDWKESLPQINGAITLADLHGMKYTGKVFVFCPWCRKKLKKKEEKK